MHGKYYRLETARILIGIEGIQRGTKRHQGECLNTRERILSLVKLKTVTWSI